MSLLDSLKEKAVKEISDKESRKEWVEKGFDAAIKEGRALLPAGDDVEIVAVREAGGYALDKLVKHKGSLVKLGQHGLRSTISMLALGDYDGAAQHAVLLSLCRTGSWGQVSGAIIATAQDGNAAKRELDVAIREIEDVLKDIGITAAKALASIFLALF